MKKIIFAFTLLITVCLTSFLLIEQNEDITIDDIEHIVLKLDLPAEEKTDYIYGFPLDTFSAHHSVVQQNQSLSDILLQHHISHQQIFLLAERVKDVFDVRRIRAGNPYTIFKTQEKGDTACYMVYEKNKIDYVVFHLNLSDSITAEEKSKPTEIKRQTASGVINSSLYLTLQEQGYSSELALKLSDIYAWSIDFYRIQKGDFFKVVYDEKFVEGQSVGVENIITSNFNHQGSDFYAFQFMQDSILDYYDDEGKSLRKAFLKAPLKFSRISSRFTQRRFHPVQKRYKAHLGTDYAAPRGTPIQATGDGVVSEARFKQYNGNYVKIRHNATYATQYLHMTKIASGVRAGTRVRQGQTIGYVGSTGLATGPHVCYRFWKNGQQVDPYKQKIPASKPVKSENMEDFKKVKDEQLKELNPIAVEQGAV